MRWILMGCVALGLGCDDGGDSGDGGVQSQPAANCQARCEAKLTTCGQAAIASSGCTSIVCGDATEQQLVCLEGSTCEAIGAAVSSGMALCGIGEDTDDCPELSGCPCGISGIVTIGGECAQNCDQACAPFDG